MTNSMSVPSSTMSATSAKPAGSETGSPSLVIGIVAGEASGDSLGADFMAQMNNLMDGITWVGVGGAQMQAQGLTSLFPLERLAVMGLVEVLAHLPDLLKARSELIEAFDEAQIDWFVGIDAPDFNLRVAKKLKPQGVFCVQYVSPSIWAWRESRIHSIQAATDLVLCLFPFELEVYERYHHPAVCVGHPLLHRLPKRLINIPTNEQRRNLVWSNTQLKDFFANRDKNISQMICMMPGSRRSEIKAILPLMLDAIHRLLLVDEQLCFVIPTIDKTHQNLVQKLINQQDESLQRAIVAAYDDTQSNSHFSQSFMAMSDLVVLASGTATLEAMLLRRPMVVVYQMNKLTHSIARRLIKVPYVALPNILAGEQIVPELIQEDATGDNVCRAVTQLLKTRAYMQQKRELNQTAAELYEQSNQSPASAVLDAWLEWVDTL